MSDPADINDRLEAAAEKAEGGSEIIRRFSNDPAGTYIPTESGPLPSLAEWLVINEEALGGVPTLTARVDTIEGEVDDLQADVAVLQSVKNEHVRPSDFGAVGNGVADDTAALLSALSDGRPVYLGDDAKTYRITAEISFTAARSVVIHSDGAKIIVDSASSIRSAIRIDLAGKGLYVSGRLFLGCQNKSFSGFYATNYGAAIAKSDVLVSGLEVSNCHRTSAAFTGGDGIWIGGNLNKLRVVDCSARNIHMAAGAGVVGSQGVSGITIARDNTNELDASLITVEGCEVGPVYSDDVTYTSDQDGIRVFTAYSSAGDNTRPVWSVVRDCRFVNCHGRAVKMQTEWGSVSNLKIERNGDIYGAGYSGNPDIDFQVAGGQVNNIQCEYRSNFPSRVLNFSLTRTDTRLNHTAVEVNGVIVSQSGTGSGVDRVAAVSTDFDAVALVSFAAIAMHGSKTPLYMLSLQSQVIAGFFGATLDGVLGRASVAFVHRLGSVLTPCFVTGKAVFNQGSSVPFATAASAGDFTTSLIGANRLVT
jgi:hypothetical protein